MLRVNLAIAEKVEVGYGKTKYKFVEKGKI